MGPSIRWQAVGVYLTVLSAQEPVEHLLHHDRVEFDQLGQSLDDFILHQEKQP